MYGYSLLFQPRRWYKPHIYIYIQSHLKIFFKIYYIFINPKLSPIQLLNFLMFVAQKSPPPKLQNKVFLLFSTNSNLGQVYKLTLLYCLGACMTSRLLIMQQPFARSAAGYLIAYQSFTDFTQSKNLESGFKSRFPAKDWCRFCFIACHCPG